MNKYIFSYQGLNTMRKYKRMVKQYAMNGIILVITAILFLPIVLDLMVEYKEMINRYAPYVILLYGVLKFMQNHPLINIKTTTFQFKLFNLKTFKAYILFKLAWPSFLAAAILFIILQEIHLPLFIAFVFNIILNYVCFIRFQYNQRIVLFVAGTVIAAGIFSIYTSNGLVAGLFLCVCCLHLMIMKKFDYSILYPYYRILSKMGEGLLNKDFTKIFEAQQVLSRRVYAKNSRNFIQFYEQDFLFHAYRELSKMIYHQKDLINIVLLLLMLNIFYHLLSEPYMYGIYSILVFAVNHLLTILNKQEIDMLKKSLIFRVDWPKFLKSKYGVELILTVTIFLINLFIIKDAFVAFIPIAVLLPAINLYMHYLEKKYFKYILTLLTGVLCILPYLYMGL